MIVVADTSPLNYLIQIDSDHLLPQLYGSIVIPSAVMSELSDSRAPLAIRQWLSHVPLWLEVRLLLAAPEQALAYLGPGEREAIQLCEELKASLLLIDERDGRLEARQRGLLTTGTLGVLLAAGDLRLIDPRKAYRRLVEETSFRISAALEARFLEQIQ
jgi:predicted nucleic acid-binding protein